MTSRERITALEARITALEARLAAVEARPTTITTPSPWPLGQPNIWYSQTAPQPDVPQAIN